MRSKQERNQIITGEEKGRLRNHCPRRRQGDRTAAEGFPGRRSLRPFAACQHLSVQLEQVRTL